MLNNLEHRKNDFSFWLCLIPLAVGFLFAALMLFLAVISTENSRRHYQAKRLLENIQGIVQPIIIPKPSWDKTTPTPTPTPTPKPKKDWRKKIGDYEIGAPMLAVPALIFGLYLAFVTVGTLPARNPLGLSGLMRRSILAMACSFLISPALLLLYLWALRMGLIG
ncbi:MAG: hypothetical protein LH614_16560 [Pyrinomonadaceae bacterium]|nr:hypothetical protein [Pyrinomonadaceae bacterium]